MRGDDRIDGLVREARAGQIDRREFVRRLAVLGLAPTAITALVAACGGTSQAPPESQPAPPAESSTQVQETGSVSEPPADATTDIPGPAWEGGTPGGNGVMVWSDDTLTYDPPLAYGLGDYYGLQNFYRGLAYYDQDNQPQLDLAESVDISDDGLTYVFKIKQGVTFSNGREVTAQDFKYTFERSSSKDIASWVQGFLGAVSGQPDFAAGKAQEISGITTPDNYTLQLQLDRPDVTVLSVVGIPPFYVLPREEVERLGDKLNSNPVGTGPFEVDSWDTGKRTYTASKFADYIYADKLPYVDSLTWSWGIPDELQYLKVSKGEADATVSVPQSAVAKLLNDSSVGDRFRQWDSLTLQWWEFNVTQKPFDDVRVRQAFNHAFNRERVAPIGYNPTGHFWPPTLLGYDDALAVYDYDPERAKSLLVEAGYGSGLDLTLPILAPTPVDQRITQLLAQDLEAVGIKVSIKTDEASIYDLGAKVQQQYQLWNMRWGMGLPDPSELVNGLIATNAPSNYGGYSNAAIDSIGQEAQAEVDRDKRGAMYAEIEKTLVEDAAFLFLGVAVRSTFTSERLQNYSWDPVVWTQWDRYWLSG